MERNCLNCHFLCKSHREENSGRELTFSLNEKDRGTLKADPTGYDRGWYSFRCYMGVWDEGVSPVAAEEGKTVFSRNRKYDCFFIKHKPSMLMPAAVELQKRADELRQLKNTQRLTIVGLWIAGIGLLLNAVAAIWKVLKC